MNFSLLRDGLLSDAETTALVGVQMTHLAKEIEEEGWKHRESMAEEIAGEPNIAALLKRAIRAHEVLLAGLNDLRRAVVKRQTVKGEV